MLYHIFDLRNAVIRFFCGVDDDDDDLVEVPEDVDEVTYLKSRLGKCKTRLI